MQPASGRCETCRAPTSREGAGAADEVRKGGSRSHARLSIRKAAEFGRGARGIFFDVTRYELLAPALQCDSSDKFDVALLDLSLPDTAVFDTVRRFRAAAQDLPIIVLTGLRDMKLAACAIRAGAEDYLLKDEVTWQVLVRSIRYSIERRAAAWAERQHVEDLTALLHAVPGNVFRLREDGILRSLSISGLSSGSDLPGIQIERSFAPAVVAALRDGAKRALESGSVVVVEWLESRRRSEVRARRR